VANRKITVSLDEGYEAAMSAYLSRSPQTLRKRRTRYPSRDEVHDRARLR
jgi:hypothetical protein